MAGIVVEGSKTEQETTGYILSYVSNSSCQRETAILSTLEILHHDYVISNAYCYYSGWYVGSLIRQTVADNSIHDASNTYAARCSLEQAFTGVMERSLRNDATN